MSSASEGLFGAPVPAAPLAERLRPRSIDEVLGQRHLLAPGKPLRLAFESGKPHSMILWGPPGTGKTTLARLMAQAFDAEFIALSAVFSGVKDIRDAVSRAEAALANQQFVFQVGAYAEPDDVIAKLKAAKIPHYTERVATEKGTVTRVRAGPFASREAAERALKRVKALGFKPGGVSTRS